MFFVRNKIVLKLLNPERNTRLNSLFLRHLSSRPFSPPTFITTPIFYVNSSEYLLAFQFISLMLDRSSYWPLVLGRMCGCDPPIQQVGESSFGAHLFCGHRRTWT